MKSKKLIGITLMGITLASSMSFSFAEYNPNKVINEPITTLSIKQQDSFKKTHINLIINNKALNHEETKVYMKKNGVTMLPLRLIVETLGYQLKWNAENREIEITKGAHWIMVKIDKDQYTFGRMSPIALGTAPEIKDGKTYVPLNFITDILKIDVIRDETGTIHINNKKNSIENLSILETTGKIVEIQKINERTRILVKGKQLKNVGYDIIALNITKDTKIKNPIDNTLVALKDLKKGDEIRVFYEPILTRSFPPIGTAQTIEVLKDIAVKDGKITDIRIDEKTSKVLDR
ncbi:Copper amine oxidase N-terminal domain-containing protein [Caminicella sporogenes DSM 14501]|uniref:Copper amine oxidase N-terminal domain-containing protein n=2 Tax=Caminicella TaxID=166484 RepID=A0A1M6TKZ6_9FIRM|nr:stalk domain-containing protein [Caminicella sporogenes]SHK57742.1 Copper amine oxidase N-terminal domain-containing protein [Caminicella sporogenes DSM 14501]